MIPSLLRTQLPPAKITSPPVRNQRIFRSTLMQKLVHASSKPLTLICAPAGYGKTSLVADWAVSMAGSIAWVSLDSGDNDPPRFWASVLGALASVDEVLVEDSLEFVSFLSTKGAETFILTLGSQLSHLSTDIWLILDDYHCIDNQLIHQQLENLFQYAPGFFHLMLVSRNRPPLHLGRLRIAGKLQELGIDDLRCTMEEVGQFYYQVFNWHPDGDSLALIHDKTEGWMVGMHLVGMAINDGCACTELLESRDGGNRLVTEYLTQEVWTTQSQEMQEFLLKTCILEQFNASLCQTVTENPEASNQLDNLYTGNAFLVALNPEKTWFRYHHLFAELLQTRLAHTHPDWIPLLHRKAAGWLMKHDMVHQAVHHILVAGDEDQAVAWIYELAPGLLHLGELTTLKNWLNRLSSRTLQVSSQASLLFAWIYSLQNQRSLAEQKLLQVRQAILKVDEHTVADSSLWSEYHTLRGYLAMIGQDADQAIIHMQQATVHMPEHSRFFQTGLELNSGEPYFLRTAMGQRGYLRRVQKLYSKLRALLKYSGLGVLGYGSIAMGELYYEWNDFEQLTYFIPRALELGTLSGDLGILIPAHLLHARTLRAVGRRAEMWEAIVQTDQLLHDTKNHSRWNKVLEAFKARRWLEEENLTAVNRWVETSQAPHYTTIQEGIEFELITLARVWLTQGKQSETERLLAQLLRFSQATDRLGAKIEILCLQALAFQQAKNVPAALTALTTALALGKPEGYRRTFLDEKPALRDLLQILCVTHMEESETHSVKDANSLFPNLTAYVDDLLSATWVEPPQIARPKGLQVNLIEPLTSREMETLNFIAAGLTNAEIAQRLHVSLGTVKGYTHHIFGKLAVRNRTEAIAQARQMGLL